MVAPAQRICSLLPSVTEIVYALGLGDRLVAVTHECDYPPDATTKPRVTASAIDSAGLSSREIDEAVRDNIEQRATIYHLDRDLLERLQPDLILTQELCAVCAVGTGEVRNVIESLSVSPRVVSLEPSSLDEVLDSILLVGRLTGSLRRAIEVRDALVCRLNAVEKAVARRDPVRVLTLEWLEPLFVGGHWVPEMVSRAGGCDVLGLPGQPSREVSWVDAVRSRPDVVVAMPCGFGLGRSMEELSRTSFPPQWDTLLAVRDGRVVVVDGSSYFNRPGPRLIDGVEILAAVLHSDVWNQAPRGSYARFERIETRSGALSTVAAANGNEKPA